MGRDIDLNGTQKPVVLHLLTKWSRFGSGVLRNIKGEKEDLETVAVYLFGLESEDFLLSGVDRSDSPDVGRLEV